MNNNGFPGTRSLKIFESAARLLNFTKAAQELFITPAAVSLQIKELEAQLEMRLFHRTSRTMALTAEGKKLYDLVEETLRSLEQGLTDIRQSRAVSCPVRITATARIATSWLLPKLVGFKDQNPDFEFELDISDTTRNLEAERYDMAVRFGGLQNPSAHCYFLFHTALVPVCSPEYLRQKGKVNIMEDYLNRTLCDVACEVNGKAWPDWSHWLRHNGLDLKKRLNKISFKESSNLVQAALEGLGVALAEPKLIEKELTEQRLIILPGEALPIDERLGYYMLLSPTKRPKPILNPLAQYLQGK